MSKVYPIIFVLDCSGSMHGAPIKVINESMQKLLEYLGNDDCDVTIKVGVLAFSNEAKWLTNGLIDINMFSFEKLEAGGLTSLGAAIAELSISMRHEFFTTDDSIDIAMPIIIFMTDGEATDNWESEINKADVNYWMKQSAKIALGFNCANEDCLYKLVKNREAVIMVENEEQIGELLDKLFYFSCVDGCSLIDSSPIKKSSRIANNVISTLEWE